MEVLSNQKSAISEASSTPSKWSSAFLSSGYLSDSPETTLTTPVTLSDTTSPVLTSPDMSAKSEYSSEGYSTDRSLKSNGTSMHWSSDEGSEEFSDPEGYVEASLGHLGMLL
eukprot:4841759-Prorocentrum_lima.AAC.1